MKKQLSRNKILLATIFLIVITAGVFLQITKHEFILYDDNEYITQNDHVLSGMTIANLKWALFHSYISNWHPITWLSHIVDIEIYGLNPGGHHLTSLIIHIINAILLFYLLIRITQSWGKSIFVAALFAIHPLHVESVAWISERKDLLSFFFMLLALLSYLSYAKRPGIRRYAVVLIFFVCGLMSKQMLMTFPIILLILDYWPLGRFRTGSEKKKAFIPSLKNLAAEKIPFFILSVSSGIIALLTQSHGGGAIGSIANYPFLLRVQTAILAYLKYAAKVFWPDGLSVHYPYTKTPEYIQVSGALLILVTITVLSVIFRRKSPYLMAGWLWYIIMLVPVIGLIQIGQQSSADRYTYIPIIGILIMIGWGVPELLNQFKRKHQKRIVMGMLPALAMAVVTLSGIAAWRQTRYWKNSEMLFSHALAVTKNNAVMHSKLALCYMDQNRFENAIGQYKEAIRIDPASFESHNNLANIYNAQDRLAEAIDHYSAAIQINPRSAEAHNNIGVALNKQGRGQEAIAQYLEALSLNEGYPEAHHNLASIYGKMGRIEEAIFHDSQAIRLRPHYAEAHRNLAISLYLKGDYQGAKDEVDLCIKNGGNVPAAFIEALTKKTPR
ncbi:MAG: tetratricopeptide repeat protein [Candidatus Aminicenantes bacterium]|nr:tetratricopeptide repeat protein [Candidatus Aminicenantes bacterium]